MRIEEMAHSEHQEGGYRLVHGSRHLDLQGRQPVEACYSNRQSACLLASCRRRSSDQTAADVRPVMDRKVEEHALREDPTAATPSSKAEGVDHAAPRQG